MSTCLHKHIDKRESYWRRALPISVLIAVVLAGGCAARQPGQGTATSDWPMFLHDARRTGASDVPGPRQPVKVRTFRAGGAVSVSPAVTKDGMLYFSTNALGEPEGNELASRKPGRFESLRQDGTVAWSVPFGRPKLGPDDVTNPAVLESSSPAVAPDGTIYFGSLDGTIRAVDPRGRVKWSVPTGGQVLSSPVTVDGGTIYVGSNDRFLYSLNAKGSVNWRFKSDGRIWSSPAIGPDGSIYFGTEKVGVGSGTLYALRPDGTQRWTFRAASIIGSVAVGADGTVFFGDGVGRLYALNSDGTKKWKFKKGRSVDGGPVISPDGTIYVVYDVTIYAVDLQGREKWAHRLPYAAWSPALGSDGTIYVGVSGPISYGGGIVLSKETRVYALNPDGTQMWSAATGGPVPSPVIGPDGTLYVGCMDGKVYAISDH